MKEIEAWTDGSSIKQIREPTKFHGGAGVVLIYNGKEKHISEPIEDGTNNISELYAPILALEALKEKCKVKIMTDSAYTMNAMTKWIKGWIRRKWKTAGGDPVKNKDLMIRLHKLCQYHQVEWVKVKGHSGNYYNDLADELACKASKLLKDKEEELLNEC